MATKPDLAWKWHAVPYECVSADGRYILQARIDGGTIFDLYHNDQSTKALAKSYYLEYKKIAEAIGGLDTNMGQVIIDSQGRAYIIDF